MPNKYQNELGKLVDKISAELQKKFDNLPKEISSALFIAQYLMHNAEDGGSHILQASISKSFSETQFDQICSHLLTIESEHSEILVEALKELRNFSLANSDYHDLLAYQAEVSNYLKTNIERLHA